MENLLVFGASGHAKVVISLIERTGRYRICGLVESFKPVGSEFFGYPILGREDDLPVLMETHRVSDLVIAVGDNHDRHLVHEKIAGIVPQIRFPSILHPNLEKARGVTIGIGTVVLAGVTMNSDAKIGDFCIIDNQGNIGHDSLLEDFVSVAPKASIGGNVTVRCCAAVAMGAEVIERVEIGSHSVIGAGATVVKDIPDHVVALGTPARVARKRNTGEKYLK